MADVIAPIKDDIARKTTATAREVEEGLTNELRQQVLAAGMGQRLANTWQGTVYPKSGVSLSPAAYVKSNAPKIVDAFDRAPTIVPINGKKYLAIPAPDAGVLHTSSQKHPKLTPEIWERETGVKLRFYHPPGKRFAVLETNAYWRRQPVRYQRRTGTRSRKPFHPIKEGPLPGQKKWIVIFFLVQSARMPKRFNIDQAVEYWAGQVSIILERRLGDAS